MNWLAFILILVTVAAVVLLLWQTIPKLHCPHCGHHKSTLREKSVAYTRRKRTTDISAGGDWGWMVENVFRKRYECQQCGQEWYVEEPE